MTWEKINKNHGVGLVEYQRDFDIIGFDTVFTCVYISAGGEKVKLDINDLMFIMEKAEELLTEDD